MVVPEPDVPMSVDIVPPPPVFESSLHEDAVSTVSSVSTLSTLSSTDQDLSAHPDSIAPHLAGRYDVRAAMAADPIPIVPPPPPPEFDGSNSSPITTADEFIPPPVEFNSPVVTNLRSVLRETTNQSHSVSYPAARSKMSTSTPSSPVEAWSVQDVLTWLDSLDLAELRPAFSQNNINGQALMQLGRSELIRLGVVQPNQRMTIERAIKQAVK